MLLNPIDSLPLGLLFRQSAYLSLLANDTAGPLPIAASFRRRCAAVELGLEDLDLVVSLHDHRLLLLALGYLLLQPLLYRFDIRVELLDFLVLASRIVLVLLALGFLFLKLGAHLLDLLLQLAHSLVIGLRGCWHTRCIAIERLVEVLAHLARLCHLVRRSVVLALRYVLILLRLLLLLGWLLGEGRLRGTGVERFVASFAGLGRGGTRLLDFELVFQSLHLQLHLI